VNEQRDVYRDGTIGCLTAFWLVVFICTEVATPFFYRTPLVQGTLTFISILMAGLLVGAAYGMGQDYGKGEGGSDEGSSDNGQAEIGHQHPGV
jgi:hypothetical protein